MKNQAYDVLIIGAGGSGLCSAIIAAKQGLKVAVVSRVHPMQSHTVAAQGGINAALGNISEDNVKWHIYDTLKASDWIADVDSVELMCNSAPDIIKMLDNLGVEFSRTESGDIDQKVYGGQSTEFGKGELAKRACYAQDKTGQTVMHRLYDKAQEFDIDFYNFHFALDLIIDNGECCGISCIDLEEGDVKIILATNTIIATGGYSQIYQNTTAAALCSGDGLGMIARCGLPLQDMEFVQFHPTALHKVGVLITEAARSSGAKLLNGNHEDFMSKYAPRFKELAPRDIVARAIASEISEGRGAGVNKDHVYLDLTHLSADYIKEQLPTIYENCTSFCNIDPSKELIPVSPASHYTMGGIPTDNSCRVIADEEGNIACHGLYAIGEAASISVHGANRLGCNSLLDLMVFAKVAVEDILETQQNHTIDKKQHFKKMDINKIIDYTKERLYSMLGTNGGCGSDLTSTTAELIAKLKSIMSRNAQLFRNAKLLEEALIEIQKIKRTYSRIKIKGELAWNTELIEHIELSNLLITAEATIRASKWRKESRGCHYREDFPTTSPEYKVHSLIWMHSKELVAREVRQSSNLKLIDPDESHHSSPNKNPEDNCLVQDTQRNY